MADPPIIEELIAAYEADQRLIDTFRQQLLIAIESSEHLSAHIHSIKSRMKDPDHLRDKIRRKIDAIGIEAFDVTPENLVHKVNDLAGVRVLHLYTEQIKEIDVGLREVFEEGQYELLEGPSARTWDDESRQFFEECGIATQQSETMYTSVHYVIGSASRTFTTCEIQVRTLMEEVWGEVDHELNYPQPTDVFSSAEQLKVLARVTSSATRLVDSIYRTHRAALRDSGPAPRKES